MYVEKVPLFFFQVGIYKSTQSTPNVCYLYMYKKRLEIERERERERAVRPPQSSFLRWKN
jgi:hypothetical protein